MSALHFESRSDGRLDAMLGAICVGQIWDFDHPTYKSIWFVEVMSARTSWQPAINTEAAKHAVTQKVSVWLKAAGLRAA
jgi:hypothetical protein